MYPWLSRSRSSRNERPTATTCVVARLKREVGVFVVVVVFILLPPPPTSFLSVGLFVSKKSSECSVGCVFLFVSLGFYLLFQGPPL